MSWWLAWHSSFIFENWAQSLCFFFCFRYF